jgi:hypothetical protein
MPVFAVVTPSFRVRATEKALFSGPQLPLTSFHPFFFLFNLHLFLYPTEMVLKNCVHVTTEK